MSEPIRYSEVSNDWNGEAAGLAPSADGEWVKYDDYAALQAEVERLRKAGDALVDEGESLARDVSFVTCVWDNRVADWNAAKEGKQS